MEDEGVLGSKDNLNALIFLNSIITIHQSQYRFNFIACVTTVARTNHRGVTVIVSKSSSSLTVSLGDWIGKALPSLSVALR